MTIPIKLVHSWHFWAIFMIPLFFFTFLFHSHLFIATIDENERKK